MSEPLRTGDPAKGHSPWRRRALNLGITAWLGVIALTSLPPLGHSHEQGRKLLARALATAGIVQPRWQLFAPNVHKMNAYLVAEVEDAAGGRRVWESPDWRGRSLLQKFFEGQMPNFYDNVRRDRNRAAWGPFADWIVRELGAPRVPGRLQEPLAVRRGAAVADFLSEP